MIHIKPSPGERVLQPREAARIIGVDTQVISRWARQGKFTRIVTPGGHSRFRASEVLAMRDSIIDGAK